MDDMSEGVNMAEDNTDQGAEGGGSKSSSVTQEEMGQMTQRTANLEAQNKQLASQLEQLIQMQSVQRQQATRGSDASDTSDEELEDLAYKDPKKYARAVEARTTKRVEAMVNSRMQHQNDTNFVLTQLAAEYPELNDTNSDLTKKAVEIYKQMPAAQQQNPLAYKIAVRDAAAEMGVLTKNKRAKSDGSDSFSVSGNSSSSAQGSQRAPKSEKLDNRTLAFAELVGLNIKDDKVLKRLQSRTNRKFGSWE